MRVTSRLGAVSALLALTAAGFVIQRCAGPDLRITSTGGKARIDTQFLGEYHLGLTKVVIADSQGAPVVKIESPSGAIANVFDLAAGTNTADSLSPATDRSAFSKTAETFVLKENHRYRIQVCGNTGFGFVGCSSGRFSL